MIFVEASKDKNIRTRIIGDNIDVLVIEAMKYITLVRGYYVEAIRNDLENKNYAIVSKGTCAFPMGLFVFYDPNHEMTEEDANFLSDHDIIKRYRIIKTFSALDKK